MREVEEKDEEPMVEEDPMDINDPSLLTQMVDPSMLSTLGVITPLADTLGILMKY